MSLGIRSLSISAILMLVGAVLLFGMTIGSHYFRTYPWIMPDSDLDLNLVSNQLIQAKPQEKSESRSEPKLENGMEVIIPAGTSLIQIGRIIQKTGMAHMSPVLSRIYPYWFAWNVRLSGKQVRLQAGEYRFTSGMTIDTLIKMMANGKVLQRSIVFLEGWTFAQIKAQLVQSPRLKQTITSLSDTEIMTLLGCPDCHPEGQFFPNTYLFTSNTTDLTILKTAHRALKNHLAHIWEQKQTAQATQPVPQTGVGVPLKTPYEALILASIVQKESAYPKEYPEIAGVYLRRLQYHMRLQADPTVAYGLDHSGALRYRHLKEPTPYNTYLNEGLPPTPIGMVSRAALEAVLSPKPGKSLYFVASGEGTHYFSNTYEEHLLAVKRYRAYNQNTNTSTSTNTNMTQEPKPLP